MHIHRTCALLKQRTAHPPITFYHDNMSAQVSRPILVLRLNLRKMCGNFGPSEEAFGLHIYRDNK